MIDETTESKPRRKVLNVNVLDRPADYFRTHYHLEIGNEFDLSDVLKPGFWAHHATKLKKFDIIEVVSADLQLDVMLRILEPGEGWVRTRVMFVGSAREQDADALESLAAEDDDAELGDLPLGYKIGHTPERQWFVTDPNGIIVSEGNETQADAHAAAVEHDETANGGGEEQ